MMGSGRSFAVTMPGGTPGTLVLSVNPKRHTLVIGIAGGGPSFIKFGDASPGGGADLGIPLRPENSPIVLTYDLIGDDIYGAIFGVGQAADVIRGVEWSNL